TKFARGRYGMVATGSPYATSAAVQMLEAGGNAMDAAAAGHLGPVGGSPANTSLGGRAHDFLRLRGRGVVSLYRPSPHPGAGHPPVPEPDENRTGYAVATVPGTRAARAEMAAKNGRLKGPNVMRPAITLAEQGFKVPPRLAATWARQLEALRSNPGAAQ